MKVVINNGLGGFHLGYKAEEWLIENKGWKEEDYHTCDVSQKVIVGCYCDDDIQRSFRSHPDVIEAVELFQSKGGGYCKDLKIVEIPDDIDWYIEDHRGYETIHEQHRTWD